MNPYNIGYIGWVIFIIGGIAAIAGGIVVFLSTLWKSREKRDGKR